MRKRNSRAMFSDLNGDGTVDGTEILQENHYYPFGMNIENPAWSGTNNYQYNGKELNTDFGLDWNDYGARWYDAGLGRFTTVDPLASSMPSWSPYSYTFNNPIAFTDPLGLAPSTSLWGDDIGSEKREESQERMRIANDKVENKGKDKVVIDKNGDKRNVSKSDIEFTVNFQEEENGPVDIEKSSNPIEDILRVALGKRHLVKDGKLDFYDIIKRGYIKGHSFGASAYDKIHNLEGNSLRLHIVGENIIDKEGSKVIGMGFSSNLHSYFNESFPHLGTVRGNKVIQYPGFYIKEPGYNYPRPLLTITPFTQNEVYYLQALYLKYKNR